MTAHPFDLAIVGAGPVGLALANWVLRDTGLSVALIDARTPQAAAQDPRALALAAGSRQLLDSLGAWPQAAAPIRTIHVSQQGRFGRTLLRHDELGQPELGHVVRYGDLVAALATALEARRAQTGGRLNWLTDTRVGRIAGNDTPGDAPLRVQTTAADGRTREIAAHGVVNAEGGLFHEQAGRSRRRDYGQVALISVVECAQPKADWAWERFTAEGPLALLPFLRGGRPAFALVWCGTPNNTDARLALSDADFLQALQQAFGQRMGRFTAVDRRTAYPLGLNAATELVKGRMVAVGNAAQTLHPVAGQGFNLGLRDAATLARVLRDAGTAEGRDAAALAAALQEFARARRADRRLTIGLTDGLPRLFSSDGPLLPHLRGAALAALDLLPPLKGALARQMMFGQRG